MINAECWVPVVGNSLYQVSDHGRVRRRFGGQGTQKHYVLSPRPGRYGYPRACLYNGSGTKKECRIHHLVLGSFVAPMPNGKECNHKDGNRKNNNIGNLEWVTRAENTQHAYDTGLLEPHHNGGQAGQEHHQAKLTKDDVLTLRRRYAEEDVTYGQLAKEYGMSENHVGLVIRGEKWSHL